MHNLILFALALLLSPALLGQEALDYAQAVEQYRLDYRQKFLQTERSPLDSAGVARLRFFPPDEAYRLACTFERTTDAEPFDLPTYSGITKPYIKYGVASFELGGVAFTLAVYQSLQSRQMPLYRDYLFIPFKDATNGDSTYGGGRYLDIRISDIQEGRLILDFNKAYNPYCAYSDGYNCPIPPPENHLPIPILAGEQGFE